MISSQPTLKLELFQYQTLSHRRPRTYFRFGGLMIAATAGAIQLLSLWGKAANIFSNRRGGDWDRLEIEFSNSSGALLLVLR